MPPGQLHQLFTRQRSLGWQLYELEQLTDASRENAKKTD